MVTVAMRELGLGVQGAIDHVGSQFQQVARSFLRDMQNLPEFPAPNDRLAARYIAGIGLFVYANVKWSFASERYFGKEGAAVARDLRMILLGGGGSP